MNKTENKIIVFGDFLYHTKRNITFLYAFTPIPIFQQIYRIKKQLTSKVESKTAKCG